MPAKEPWPDCLRDAQTSIEWMLHAAQRVPAGFRVDGRILDQHLLWFVADGRCQLRLDGRDVALVGGSLLWLPPGLLHSASIPAGARPFFAYSFRFRVRDGRGRGLGFAAPLLIHERHDLRETFEQIYQDRVIDDRYAAERLKAQLFLLYTALQREPSASGHAGRLDAVQRRQLLAMVREHRGRRPSPADLAALLELSPDYFARCFRASFGCSPRRWLVEQRVREAAFQLQHSPQPIAAIAAGLGYDDENLFSRQFRSVMGCSPRSYRSR